MKSELLAFGLPGGVEWIVILVFALLIFGRRLPDVARSVGKSIVEFKKGIRDVKTDIDAQSHLESSSSNQIERKTDPSATSSSSATSSPSSTKTPNGNGIGSEN